MEPIDVRDLLQQPASTREIRREEALEGLATELVQVRPSDAVTIDIVLESVVEGILASGSVAGRWVSRCARCLARREEDFRIQVAELFAPEAPNEDDDVYPIDDHEIDLEPMIRDAVVLSMPFSPLCRADCRGLCERCGGDRNLGECACPPPVDPRWAPLTGLEL